MRILHTSDWHLGRSFHRVGLLEAQAAALDHLVEVVRAEQVDAVVVAGDVYDRALPGVDVVALLDEALARLAGTGAAVVLSSGNHDSPRRLGFAARLMERSRVHVRTDPARCGEPVLLEDRHGPVALYPLPYLEPALAGPVLGCAPGAGHEGVLGAAMAAVRTDLAHRPRGTRSVVAAHAFVVGGEPSDSERDISVGGAGAVPAGVFAGVDYVALGHLHGRQQVSEGVRYSGSPLAYSFSERGRAKGSWLVELGAGGLERVDAVDAPVPRPLAVLRGPLDTLLTDPAFAAHEQAWCQVTLTDDERPAEAMTRLRARFPHTLELRFEPGTAVAGGSYSRRVAEPDDVALCCGFVEHVRRRAPSEAERELLAAAVEGARVGLARESGVAPLRAGRPLVPALRDAGSAHRQERVAG
ncbi:MAG TPA: exonuclease SbcCD subunit D [Kineosporiaceae bacterium]|nr:exonuclease SbcCD subunit D [Kineosporiaceae bacterium]